jgi:hypothetical protein
LSVVICAEEKLIMRIRRLAMSAAFAAGVAALPLATAQAQYYCSPAPLAWPFCAAGAIVGTAATIATAPFWLLAGAPYYGYYPPPYYPAPSYYPTGYAAPSVSYAPPPSPAAAPSGAPAPIPPPPRTAHPSGSAVPAPPQHAYYYFCPESHGYYPYVAHCAVAWRRVPATPPQRSAAR